jgi:hypothetical protein
VSVTPLITFATRWMTYWLSAVSVRLAVIGPTSTDWRLSCSGSVTSTQRLIGPTSEPRSGVTRYSWKEPGVSPVSSNQKLFVVASSAAGAPALARSTRYPVAPSTGLKMTRTLVAVVARAPRFAGARSSPGFGSVPSLHAAANSAAMATAAT